jgi:hypothetical protein
MPFLFADAGDVAGPRRNCSAQQSVRRRTSGYGVRAAFRQEVLSSTGEYRYHYARLFREAGIVVARMQFSADQKAKMPQEF